MPPLNIKVKQLSPKAKLPFKATQGSVCYDIYTSEDVYIKPQKVIERAYLIPTGLAFEIPQGYHFKIHLRSSTGSKTKLRLANQTGIIDTDYTGELMICVENIGNYDVSLVEGTCIAQLELCKNVDEVTFSFTTEELKKTQRGKGGFGSTTNTNKSREEVENNGN